MKKIFALLIVAILCICTWPAFASDASPVKIGVIAPLTGPVAVYGTAAANGVLLYTKVINVAGGLNGHPVETIVYDDKGDPTEALNAYNKLVTADEVAAIVGPVTSSPTFGVAEASAADNVPGITATATHPDVTTYGKNFFRACFEDPFQGGAMARFSADKLGAKTAAVLYNVTDAYSTGLYNAFTAAAAKAGLEITAVESYSKDDVDFNAQLTNIAKKSPDVLFLPDYYNTVYLICSQARNAGIKSVFVGVDGADGVLEIEGADVSAFDGLYFASHYFPDDPAELVQSFRKNYEAEYGSVPNSFAALGYDAAMILYDAIAKASAAGIEAGVSEKSYQAIIDAMTATALDCVTGHITFENNNPVKDVSVIKIDKGAYTFETKYR
ncbi:MAG: ABC transporter substrate-binding protein [Synergistaceae bacterium]|nr:ABC transporter substrate-binding protein [Synergistaceae bacterium]